VDEAQVETMKAFAGAAASAAGREIAESLRLEMRQAFIGLERRVTHHIRAEMDKHFGGMAPGQHVIQHNRLERFLKFADDAQGGFVKGVASQVGKWLVLGLMGLYVLYEASKRIFA
jgi:uncharacterized MAPEG superfamily protein